MNEATIRTIRTNEMPTSMGTTSYTRNIAIEKKMGKALILWIEDQT